MGGVGRRLHHTRNLHGDRATGEGKITRIGNHCLLMAYAHVAHNCVVGDHAILANSNAAWRRGGLSRSMRIWAGWWECNQFCRIGAHAMIGACSKVTQDILPYITADGHPARPRG